MGRLIAALLLVLATTVASAREAAFDDTEWKGLLAAHVQEIRDGHASDVDYAGMRADRALLTRYLARVALVPRAHFDSWSTEDQLAFLVNVYNAATIELVLTGSPGLHSIKELGTLWRSPWKIAFVHVFGQTYTLDEIEHSLILESGRYHDPRVHFAINCASKGCPALRPEAYRGADLDRQLEDQAVRFLGDRARNGRNGSTLTLSPIFRWYRSDFEGGWRDATSLYAFLARYREALSLSRQELANLVAGRISVAWSDYDWSLNSAPSGR